jgi:uncharacterized protein HemY
MPYGKTIKRKKPGRSWKASPEDPAVDNQKGLFYLWKNEHQKAMRYFRQAIAQEPEKRDYIENALDTAEALESFSEAESSDHTTTRFREISQEIM